MVGDEDTSLKKIKEKVTKFTKERDWAQFHNPKELAISLNLEASELLELFQWKEKEEFEDLENNRKLIERIREELADILIYSINLANRTGIDLSNAILDKLKQNEKRYPIEKAKGSAKKYKEGVK